MFPKSQFFASIEYFHNFPIGDSLMHTLSLHKSAAILSMILAGAIAIALPGCKSSEPPSSYGAVAAPPTGPVVIHQMGGGIDVAQAPFGANLNTMGGDIHLGDVSGFANVKTMGGDITIDRANAPVEATTMAGKIAITGASGSVHATTMAGNIWVSYANPSATGQTIELTSNSGGIELAVPKDFSMDVEVTLTYTKNAFRTYEIIDDMGLTRHTDADWDTSKGIPQKSLHAAGRAGSGANRVIIKTINGDVTIKKAV